MKFYLPSVLVLNPITGSIAVLLLFGASATVVRAEDEIARIFQPVASFDVMAGNGSAVAEIIDVSRNGEQLVYTDSEKGEIGFIDIKVPGKPKAGGVVVVGGEPTSVAVLDPLVLVVVNTSKSFAKPSGKLVVVDRVSRKIVAEHALPGQPDSIAIAPDRLRAAIAIENERDEKHNSGLMPQYPDGALVIVDLQGKAGEWGLREVDLSALKTRALQGSDLEPEFVDINANNEVVVTFQENNHIAIVDLVSGKMVSDFSAGSVDLYNVDTVEDGLIRLDADITRRREPDAVTWAGKDRLVTANEGDYEDGSGSAGGSRSFTMFTPDGSVVFESEEALEHLLVAAGHYNERRSQKKGIEPEAVEFGLFGERELLFVGMERANAVGVYEMLDGKPWLLQVLPTGLEPEGLKAIAGRELFVVATEVSMADEGIPAMINIYELQGGKGSGKESAESRIYPMILSGADAMGLPIPWAALSGLVADPQRNDRLYAVSDSFLAKAFIYTIDIATTPARIVARLEVTGASAKLDLEGIAVGPDGKFWLGSEGAAPGGRENLVLKVDATTGAVLKEISLPAAMVDQRRANGIEGIAVTGPAGSEVVYIALQRAWPKEGDIDKTQARIGRYRVAGGDWGFVHYPLEVEGNGGWIGLSELTLLPGGEFALIERDKGWGASTGLNAELKSVYSVALAAAEFRAFDDPAGLVTVEKSLLLDLLPALQRNSIWTPEKLEGFAVTHDGSAYAVTDNDGVGDVIGETVFLRLGKLR